MGVVRVEICMKPTYAQRNSLLIRLGYASYTAYLDSDVWNAVRSAALSRDAHRCVLCGREAEAVHHTDYDEPTLRGESLNGVVSVCHGCHEKIEFNRRGEKRTLIQAVDVFHTMEKNRKRGKSVGSLKPRCACGKFRRHNRLKCRECDPNGGIVTHRGNRHLLRGAGR